MNSLTKNSIVIAAMLFSGGIAAQTPTLKLVPVPTQKLKNTADSVQYALGAYLAQWALTNGFTVTDPQAFLTGMEDMLKNKPRLLKDETLNPFLTAYQLKNQAKLAKSQEDLLFASIKDKPGLGKLPSGVQYTILKAGKGPRPAETDSVVLGFKGALPSGAIFEDSYAQKTAVLTVPALMIPGLSEAIQLMPLGSIWEIYVPSALAYAEKGNPPNIPPNSALVVLIELIQIRSKKG
jgi:FKBP-type peptidyl-prolyl cis-trans isomerase FklB